MGSSVIWAALLLASQLAGLPIPAHERLPTVYLVNSVGGWELSQTGRFAAATAAHGRTIYLYKRWSDDNASDYCLLVHEMVHHLQDGQGIAGCLDQEPVAYRVQAQCLERYGRADLAVWARQQAEHPPCFTPAEG